MHRQDRECAGSDRAGIVVCIKCSLCRDRAGTVHRLSRAKRPTCIIIYAVIEERAKRDKMSAILCSSSGTNKTVN